MREGRSHSEKSIRAEYVAHGVESYYTQFGPAYRNPHEVILEMLLMQLVPTWTLDLSHVLDLAAGSGEVTLVLKGLGAQRIDAIDPYTAEAYAARTNHTAERHTFADIAAGCLAGRRYSLIVCSFAMHLCEKSRLPGLSQQLSQLAPSLLIISPHKRPVLKEEWGWRLENETVVSRVRARLYSAQTG